MLGRTVPVAMMIGMISALVPSVVLFARHGSAARKMKIPFGPFLALGGVVALFAGQAHPRRVPAPAVMEPRWSTSRPRLTTTPRLRAGASARGTATRRDVIPERLCRQTSSSRRGGGSFAGAVDEGSRRSASRALAEQYHLPLVDLAVAGVDAEAVEDDRAAGARARRARSRSPRTAARSRSRSPTRRTCAGSTSCGSRRACRSSSTSRRRATSSPSCAASSRAAEAMNATFAEEMAGVEEEEEDVDDLEADDGISDAPLVRLVNSMIFQAAEDGASDIHVEPQEDELVVRYRIDGVLHVAHRIPKRLASGVTTRLKVLAKLDIAERRKPQDGRISLNAAAAGRMLDIRVATLPTVEGEAVTMRLLDKSREVPTLGALGLSDEMQRADGRDPRPADRRAPRHRADRLGQVDDALRGAERDQPAGDQHHHRRGSRRVPARRRQPGADQPARRADASPPRCARSSAPTPTWSWSARSATARRRGSRSRPR